MLLHLYIGLICFLYLISNDEALCTHMSETLSSLGPGHDKGTWRSRCTCQGDHVLFAAVGIPLFTAFLPSAASYATDDDREQLPAPANTKVMLTDITAKLMLQNTLTGCLSIRKRDRGFCQTNH